MELTFSPVISAVTLADAGGTGQQKQRAFRGENSLLLHGIERYENIADVVINGGYGELEPSTIVDCTGDEPVIVRQGKGILQY